MFYEKHRDVLRYLRDSWKLRTFFVAYVSVSAPVKHHNFRERTAMNRTILVRLFSVIIETELPLIIYVRREKTLLPASQTTT